MTNEIEIRIGFALCGSFCTFERVIKEMEALSQKGYSVLPIMSVASATTDTRFGSTEYFKSRITEICGKKPICDIASAEPIGPKS